MIELHEIEELAKNVNRGAIKAFLRNAAILKDPAATPEMKELAAANVKAIAANQPVPKPKAASKPKKTKVAAAEQATQLAQTPSPQTPAAATPQTGSPVQPSPKMEFHEEFARHHGVDPLKFKAAWEAMSPQEKQVTRQWHNQMITAPKMAKSIDTLYNLFMELKKRL